MCQIRLVREKNRVPAFRVQMRECHLCRVAGNTIRDLIWHVSSRSDVATVRTATYSLVKQSLVTLRYKGKVFPYSLPSIGPGADPGVQAVSPQVT